MQQSTLIFKKSYFLEKALKIILEVTYPDLSTHQFIQIKRLLDSLKSNQKLPPLTDETLNILKYCITLFKQSTTWQFLRDDLRNEIEGFNNLIIEA